MVLVVNGEALDGPPFGLISRSKTVVVLYVRVSEV